MYLLLFVAFAVAAGESYGDKVTIDGIGEVALPSGKWLLEHAVTPEKKDRPDVYVFKKVGDRLERLTFQKFAPRIAHPIRNYVDSIGDSVSNGIPIHLLGNKRDHDAYHIVRPAFGSDEELRTSLIYTSETRDPWLGACASSASCKGGVLVCIHALNHMHCLQRQFGTSIRDCDPRLSEHVVPPSTILCTSARAVGRCTKSRTSTDSSA